MKRNQYYLCILALIWLGLIFNSKAAQIGASEGIRLCTQAVIPSLFPFFFVSNLTVAAIQSSNSVVKKRTAITIIPREIWFPALLGGYPMGCSAVTKLYQKEKITKKQAEKLLFCNQPGPAFLFGIVSQSFSNIYTVGLLWVIILVSWILTASIVRPECTHLISGKESQNSINETMACSLQSMAKVCGWIILFRIILEYLKIWLYPYWPAIIQIIVSGALELTNGCLSLNTITNENTRFILCTGMLAFGGICVTMQSASIAAPLSLLPYCKAKLLQTTIAVVLSIAVCHPRFRLPIAVILSTIFLFRVDFLRHFHYNIANKKKVMPCCFVKKLRNPAITANTVHH